MKKIISILMLFLGLVVKADWEVVVSGNDRETETNNTYPGVSVLYDHNDSKYDIYRFTWDHGYSLEKGRMMNKGELEEKISPKFPFHKVLIYKGKECINLTAAQVQDILKDIKFEEINEY